MKARTLVLILILVLAVLIVAGGCATGKKAQKPDVELFKKLSGTWVNKDYDGYQDSRGSKLVVRSDGTRDVYKSSDSKNPMLFIQFIAIIDTRTDSEGDILYKATWNENAFKSIAYEIGKISYSGTVWEFVWSTVELPEEIDPNHQNYQIYYR